MKNKCLYLNFSDDYFYKYKHFYLSDCENFIMKCGIRTLDRLGFSKTYISELIFNDFRITTEQEFLNLIGGIDVQNSSNNL